MDQGLGWDLAPLVQTKWQDTSYKLIDVTFNNKYGMKENCNGDLTFKLEVVFPQESMPEKGSILEVIQEIGREWREECEARQQEKEVLLRNEAAMQRRDQARQMKVERLRLVCYR